MKRRQFLFLGLILSFMISCAQNPYGTSYESSDARKMQQVLIGTVVRLNAVTIDGDGNVIGTIGGAAIGGILGSAVGAGKGSDVAAVAGGLLGGVLGNKASSELSKRDGVNIVVKLDNGKTVAIVQQVDKEMIFRVGDKVNVYTQGGISRVVLIGQ